jgi:uncharacterized protein (UPF0147 family)
MLVIQREEISTSFIPQAKQIVLGLLKDNSIPKNMRKRLQEVVEKFDAPEGNIQLKLNAGISALDEISNDSNVPPHIRTSLWQVASLLEKASSDAKKGKKV